MTKRQRATELVELLNKRVGQPTEPYQKERDDKGMLVTNPGVFVIDGAMRRYRLERMPGNGIRQNPWGHMRYPIGPFITFLNVVLDTLDLNLEVVK